ncbi:hypothetical protein K9M79_08250 [Candidatus Woesearchaeota archaeon]|nr:hypothetical protein [Candidatus Woesearchaeota archaeon]
MKIKGIKGSRAKPNKRRREPISRHLSVSDLVSKVKSVGTYLKAEITAPLSNTPHQMIAYASELGQNIKSGVSTAAAYVPRVDRKRAIIGTTLLATLIAGYGMRDTLNNLCKSTQEKNVDIVEVNTNSIDEVNYFDSQMSPISIFKSTQVASLDDITNPAAKEMTHYQNEINTNVPLLEKFAEVYGNDSNPDTTRSKLLRLLLTEASQESGLQHLLSNNTLISSTDDAAGLSMFRPIAVDQVNQMMEKKRKAGDIFYMGQPDLDEKLIFQPTEEGRIENIKGMTLYLRLLLEKHKGHEGMVELEYVAGQTNFDNYVKKWGNDFQKIKAGIKALAKKDSKYNEPAQYVERIWGFKKMYDQSSNTQEYMTKMLWRKANDLIDQYKMQAHRLENRSAVERKKGHYLAANQFLKQATSKYHVIIGFSHMLQTPSGNAKKSLMKHLAVSHYRLGKDEFKLGQHKSAMENANMAMSLDPHKKLYSSDKQHAPMLYAMAKKAYLARK